MISTTTPTLSKHHFPYNHVCNLQPPQASVCSKKKKYQKWNSYSRPIVLPPVFVLQQAPDWLWCSLSCLEIFGKSRGKKYALRYYLILWKSFFFHILTKKFQLEKQNEEEEKEKHERSLHSLFTKLVTQLSVSANNLGFYFFSTRAISFDVIEKMTKEKL